MGSGDPNSSSHTCTLTFEPSLLPNFMNFKQFIQYIFTECLIYDKNSQSLCPHAGCVLMICVLLRQDCESVLCWVLPEEIKQSPLLQDIHLLNVVVHAPVVLATWEAETGGSL